MLVCVCFSLCVFFSVCVCVCAHAQAHYLWLCGGRGIGLLHQHLTVLHPLGHHGAGACGQPTIGLCRGCLLGQGSLQPLHNTTHTHTEVRQQKEFQS